MTDASLSKRKRSAKPDKPCPDFPPTVHDSKTEARKVRHKIEFSRVWDVWTGAIDCLRHLNPRSRAAYARLMSLSTFRVAMQLEKSKV